MPSSCGSAECTTILDGEFEEALVKAALAPAGADGRRRRRPTARSHAWHSRCRPGPGCRRSSRYAALQVDGERRVTGYTEASRGCKHRCRHCPIVPVYDGRFRIVAPDVVLADVARTGRRRSARTSPSAIPTSSTASARPHGGRTASRASVRASRYDVTIKVEHLLQACRRAAAAARHRLRVRDERGRGGGRPRARLPRQGAYRAPTSSAPSHLCEAAGLPMSPTFVTFTPWTTIASYLRLPPDDRPPRPGRARRADPARDPAARDRQVPAAGARGHARGSSAGSIRCRSRIPGRTRIRGVDALHAAVAKIVGVRIDAPAGRGLRQGVGGGPRARRSRAVAPPAAARPPGARVDPVPHRALVLLSGAQCRAGGSGVTRSCQRSTVNCQQISNRQSAIRRSAIHNRGSAV